MPWNDTDVPLAIFFTFRTYGTWLHRDERKSVDRHNNVYRSPRIEPNKNWKRYNRKTLNHKPVLLNAAQRTAVRRGIALICAERGWVLSAINVRTNHIHCVVRIGAHDPDRALAALKARATYTMRECNCWPHEYSPWAEKGSVRRLWTDRSIWEACNYVLNRQGDDLPDVEAWNA
jgi:REP element-mobilizing transposase RayT